MKTEFMIPFEIDTSAVEAKLEADGYEEVVKRLASGMRRDMESKLPKRYGTIDWERAVWQEVDKFITDHADEIIDTTVLLLAQKVGNRKRWRDVLKDIKEGTSED